MKNLIAFTVFLITGTLFSQNVDLDLHGYSQIYSAEDMTQENLHNRLKEWVALNYGSANDAIQLDSNEKIIVKGIFSYFSKVFGNDINIDHTLLISIKENRYKVDLVLPQTVVVTKVYGQEIETNIFEEELRNKVTFDVLVKRFTNSFRAIHESEKNYEKKLKRALTKKEDVFKNQTLVFKQEFSGHLNNNVNALYQGIKEFVNRKDDW
ncbi:DUF4468 domain-containing protein [Flagellimonas oceanensis]|uniref:DUF4468 domain-containing protein n=1 Tax=Flagellimonas oceanensis TaxID=2499163 RepID=UPI000C95CB08|nr:hypothetical protein [Allomuricauda sp.]